MKHREPVCGIRKSHYWIGGKCWRCGVLRKDFESAQLKKRSEREIAERKAARERIGLETGQEEASA